MGNRKDTAALPPASRSAVTNGRRQFVDGDGRSPWARRYRDLIESHASDLGGLDMLSEAQKSLLRRAAALEIELEALEGKLSRGESVDLDMFGRLSGHLRRVLETVGIQRVAKEVDGSDYLLRHFSKPPKGNANG